ncbi:MAG: hypothetical protein QOK12_2757 [Mycobacterium sp.]|nr:hypothetical protein [Mycobacterium sp.]
MGRRPWVPTYAARTHSPVNPVTFRMDAVFEALGKNGYRWRGWMCNQQVHVVGAAVELDQLDIEVGAHSTHGGFGEGEHWIGGYPAPVGGYETPGGRATATRCVVVRGRSWLSVGTSTVAVWVRPTAWLRHRRPHRRRGSRVRASGSRARRRMCGRGRCVRMRLSATRLAFGSSPVCGCTTRCWASSSGGVAR